MSKILSHKVQLALAVAKGRRQELIELQKGYLERWRVHANRQGKDPDKPPRTIYKDMIDDAVERINKEIKLIEKRVK